MATQVWSVKVVTTQYLGNFSGNGCSYYEQPFSFLLIDGRWTIADI